MADPPRKQRARKAPADRSRGRSTSPTRSSASAGDQGRKARPRSSRPAAHGGWLVGCGLLIAVAGTACYSNSLSGPFILDDLGSIVGNLTIRDLGDIGAVMSPPKDGNTVQGRPVLNLSLAVNYALNGLDTWGYHVFNLCIHLACALLLFGIVRRTLLRLQGREEAFSPWSTALALSVALVWVTHPLTTAAVSYVIQRAEALMALFFLLTLYCTIRSVKSGRPVAWQGAAVASCMLGMGSKEVMVSAPLVVLLYDRTFLTGSLRESVRRRKWLYAGLAASWALLAWLVVGAGSRGGTAGYGSVSSWDYARTQLVAIVTYLRLMFWPHPLVFDYGTGVSTDPWQVWPSAVVVATLFAASLAALRWRPAAAFLGIAFFAVLAPTSSVVPVLTQTVAEHRVYLPLSAVLALVISGMYVVGERLLQRLRLPPERQERLGWIAAGILVAAVTVTMGWLTWLRNADYRSTLAIWQDTLDKRPDNPRARHNLGMILAQMGRHAEAMAQFNEVLRRNPSAADAAWAHSNLGSSLGAQGKYAEAIGHFREAVALKSDFPEGHNNLGIALRHEGKADESIAHFRQAVRLKPDYAAAQANLASGLLALGRYAEAMPHLNEALRANPRSGLLHYNRAVAYYSLGDHVRAWDDAQLAQNYGVQLDPQFLRQLQISRDSTLGSRPPR